MKRYVRANDLGNVSPSEYLCNNFDHYPKGMKTYDINGKQITTNLLAYDYARWGGNTTPRCKTYGKVDKFGTIYGAFDALVAEGYTEIKFAEMPTSIRGYHHVYYFAK